MPDWIPEPWNLVATAILPVLWWALRRQNRAAQALVIAQKALDLLAWFLSLGKPAGTAKQEAVEVLVAKGTKREVAARAVAGAAAKLGLPSTPLDERRQR